MFCDRIMSFGIFINNENQINEIGDINFFSYEEAIDKIRPYHTERKKILTQVYIYIMNILIKTFKEIKK